MAGDCYAVLTASLAADHRASDGHRAPSSSPISM